MFVTSRGPSGYETFLKLHEVLFPGLLIAGKAIRESKSLKYATLGFVEILSYKKPLLKSRKRDIFV